MKHLKSSDEVNEGIKEILIGGLLVLSSIFPNQALSNNIYNYDGDDIEVIETKNSIDRKELIKTLKRLERDGFQVETGRQPISMLIKKLKDGDFIILNTSAQQMAAANFMLSQIVENDGGDEVIRLIKKTGRSYQAIVVISK